MYLWHGPREFRGGYNRDAPVLWKHAEEFLAKLDACDQDAEHRDDALRWQLKPVLQKACGIDPFHGPSSSGPEEGPRYTDAVFSDLNTFARRWFLAECSAFVLNASLDTERWSPYVDWVRTLSDYDSIVTFNYDLVLEKLAESIDKWLKLKTPTGGRLVGGRLDLFKLHGSVNWWVTSEGAVEIDTDDDHRGIWCEREQQAIWTPGPNKSESVDRWRHYWDEAMCRVRKAKRVFLVGYRLPETDPLSLKMLLTALRENKEDVHVYVVLGPPSLSGEHSERLKYVLRHLSSTIHTEVVPIYAQDFLCMYAMKPDAFK